MKLDNKKSALCALFLFKKHSFRNGKLLLF